MTSFLIFAAAVVLLILVTATVRAISTDGRGHLPPIRSHPEWGGNGEEQTGLPPAGHGAFSTLPYLP